jgi:hypothetical protein
MDTGIVGYGGISGIHVNAWKDVEISVAVACDLNEKPFTVKQQKEKQDIQRYISKKEHLKKLTKAKIDNLKKQEKFAI